MKGRVHQDELNNVDVINNKTLGRHSLSFLVLIEVKLTGTETIIWFNYDKVWLSFGLSSVSVLAFSFTLDSTSTFTPDK